MKDANKKILYIDCFSGISGDMFIGSFFDLGLNEKKFKNELSKVLSSHAKIKIWDEKRGGFTGKDSR